MPTGPHAPKPSNAAAMGIVVGAVVIFAAFVLALVLVWGFVAPRGEAERVRNEESQRREALASLVIPDFTLHAQDGRPVTRDDLLGKWTVLSFGFTHCTLVCPIMHGQLYRVQGMIDDLPNVQILSVSVDPEHDTVQRLAEYADQMGAEPDHWTFATADADTLQRLMTDGLGLGYQTDDTLTIDLGDGASMANISHSSRFIVVSPEARVTAMYRGTEPDEVDRMISDLRAWARQ